MKLLLISGPLGSGKTTRLNQILRQVAERQLTALCIINDIGQTNVDASRVQSVGEVLPLTTGCVCCESAGALERTLKEATQKEGLDLIIIEPTGIADATTIRDIGKKLGFDWHCLCLVDVKHFELNRTIGIEQFQLPAATVVGLTWAEGILDLTDPALEPVLAYIGKYSNSPIQILAQNDVQELEILLSSKESGFVISFQIGKKQPVFLPRKSHQHTQVYATSIEFAEGVDETTLLPVLVDLYQNHGLIRAKGICQRTDTEHQGLYTWDFTQGTIQWGKKTEGVPGGNFISSSEDLVMYLKFMCKSCDENIKKVSEMDVFMDSNVPVEKTIEAINYLLSQYPDPITKDGRVLTNCDADPAKHLARRTGVPREVHENAYRTSVKWRIKGFHHLVRQWKAEVWPDDYAFYRACFILGKALINTLEIDWVNELMSQEIRNEINSLPATELMLVGWKWMEENKPEEIAENLKVESVYRVLRYAMQHGLDQQTAEKFFTSAIELFKTHRTDYDPNEWVQKL